MRYPKQKHFQNVPGGNSSSSGIGGSTGAVDNAILRANGAGGSTLQPSALVLADDGSTVISTTKTKVREIQLEQHSGILTGQSTVLAAADIDNGDSVTIEILWAAKDDDANTGAGGCHICTWTKAAGVLQKVFEDDTRKGSDIGQVVSVTTLDVGGAIRAEISIPTAANGNFSASWYARIVQRKLA